LKGPAGSSNAGSRSASPALGTASLGRKVQNEAFFAKMGAENASRPDDLPPSEGGKVAGFGSDWQPPPAASRSQLGGSVIPGAEEFQKDPIAALTKGFGWFGGVVQKGVGEGLQKVSFSSSFCLRRTVAIYFGAFAHLRTGKTACPSRHPIPGARLVNDSHKHTSNRFQSGH
jgi:hypothetical protein